MYCEVAHLIMKYLDDIFNVFNYITFQPISPSQTKCLNTALLMILLMTGVDGFNKVDRCSVKNIRIRNTTRDESVSSFNTFKKDLLSKKFPKKDRYLYYVMITDGYMKSKYDTLYFPGHVFVIEKYKEDSKNVRFRLYQSYINQYTMKEHFEKASYSHEITSKLNSILSGLDKFINSDETFSTIDNKFWKYLTYIDHAKYIGYRKNELQLCYQRVEVSVCYNSIFKFSEACLKSLQEPLNVKRIPTESWNNMHTSLIKLRNEARTLIK
jgi:hypothetical protein